MAALLHDAQSLHYCASQSEYFLAGGRGVCDEVGKWLAQWEAVDFLQGREIRSAATSVLHGVAQCQCNAISLDIKKPRHAGLCDYSYV